MQKLLLSSAILTLLLTSGCSTLSDTFSGVADVIPNSLERTPLFFKINVQQGNLIEQSVINRLEPGMSKSQVQFLMGTPLLVDVFHQNRWDYYYSMKIGNGKTERKQLSLFFEDNRLVGTKGDMRPMPVDDDEPVREVEVYSVPDYNDTKGILSRMIEKISFEDN